MLQIRHQIEKVMRDEEVHNITLKGSIISENITILSVYAPNNRASNSMRQKLMDLQGNVNQSITSWRCQQPSPRNGQIQPAETQQGHH